MSRIKELRTNEDYNLNIVSILEMFSPEGKSKYTETLLRMMKYTPNLKEHTKEMSFSTTDSASVIFTNEFSNYFFGNASAAVCSAACRRSKK
jgi:hypothetical protein